MDRGRVLMKARTRLLRTLLVLLSLGVQPVAAQEPVPGAGNEGMLAVAVVFPSGTENIFVVAQSHQLGDAILLTDDGSIRIDMAGDGEYWALLAPTTGTNLLELSGTVNGREIWHEEAIELPSAWMATNYPVTLLAREENGAWVFERALFGSLPNMEGPTGAGVAGKAETLGLSAQSLYLLWGFLILALVSAALIRSSVLRAQNHRD